MIVRVGTRKSALAVKQAENVQTMLATQNLKSELVYIESLGDQNTSKALYDLEPSEPGLFTKQLEKALLENKIDIAVHSLKDLPTVLPTNLKLACVPERVSSQELLIIHPDFWDGSLELGLKLNTVVGTSSLRREAQILSQRPDLKVESIRGNVPSRLDKVRNKKYGATLLAKAGLDRLDADLSNFKVITLPADLFVPAPGQGALGIETRENINIELDLALKNLQNSKVFDCVSTERAVLNALEGGCSLPLGCECVSHSEGFTIRAFLGMVGSNIPGEKWRSFHLLRFQGKDRKALLHQTIAALKEIQNGSKNLRDGMPS